MSIDAAPFIAYYDTKRKAGPPAPQQKLTSALEDDSGADHKHVDNDDPKLPPLAPLSLDRADSSEADHKHADNALPISSLELPLPAPLSLNKAPEKTSFYLLFRCFMELSAMIGGIILILLSSSFPLTLVGAGIALMGLGFFAYHCGRDNNSKANKEIIPGPSP
jgi:hypothetical protein